MERIAKCHCGNLTATCQGEPHNVVMCHCGMCQRRTGTAFHLGAWWEEDDVSICGEYNTYTREGELGNAVDWKFCPTCGTTVWWKADSLAEGNTAIAVGCFADPDFPSPQISFFGNNRFKWVVQPDGSVSFEGNMGSDEE